MAGRELLATGRSVTGAEKRTMRQTIDPEAEISDGVHELRPSPAVRPTADDTRTTLRAGGTVDPQLGALSTAVARLASDYGRSPARATSWRLDGSCVVTALEDFLTPAERALIEDGDARLVQGLRSAFVEAIGDEYARAAEKALGRKVIAHRSELIRAASICLEIFLLANEPRRPGLSPSDVRVPNPQHSPG